MKQILIGIILIISYICNGQTYQKYVDSGDKKIDNKDFFGAIDEYNKALKFKPNDAFIYGQIGYCKHLLEDYKGAVLAFTKSINFDSQDSYYFIHRGFAKERLDDLYGAIEDYTKAIELKDSSAYSFRGLVKAELNDHVGAIVDINKAIEINPKNAYLYYKRGRSKGELQDLRGELMDLTKAVETAPQDGFYYYSRGLTKGSMGNFIGGCLDLSKAGELGYTEAYEAIKKFCKDIPSEHTNNTELSLINKISKEEYLGLGLDHWIDKNHDGEIIKLEDGSTWEVLDYDVYNSMLWLPVDDVKIKKAKDPIGEYNYIMKNEDESVYVKLLKQ
jgi:tetratricopeptide (TPR) repeat protein